MVENVHGVSLMSDELGERHGKKTYTRLYSEFHTPVDDALAVISHGEGGAYSFVACLSRMAIDHASLTRPGGGDTHLLLALVL